MRTLLKKSCIVLLALSITSLTSCKKEEDSPNSTTPFTGGGNTGGGNTVTAPYYFKGKIDGKLVVANHTENIYNGVSNGVSGGTSTTNDNKYIVEQNTIFTNALDQINNTTNYAQFYGGVRIKREEEPVDQAEVITLYGTGSFSYATDDDEAIGATIEYVDKQGNYWATYLGTADQTGSTFSITEYVDNPNKNSDGIPKIVKMVFKCTLYDQNGNSKTVTEGEIRGRFIFY